MGYRGCCSFPHGQNSVLAMISAIIAYILTVNATYTCTFWSADTDLSQTLSGPVGIGLFSYQNTSTSSDFICYEYTNSQLQSLWDGPFIAAYVFAIFANTCIGISMILLFIVGCCDFGRSMLRGIGIASILGTMFMTLTFVGYASFVTDPPYNATFSVGSGLAIGAACLALITGLLIISAPLAQSPIEQAGVQPFAPGTVTKTETVMPDGSRKVTTTTVNPDGSKTVTETVEQVA